MTYIHVYLTKRSLQLELPEDDRWNYRILLDGPIRFTGEFIVCGVVVMTKQDVRIATLREHFEAFGAQLEKKMAGR